MSRVRRATAWTVAMLVTLLGAVLVAGPAEAATPTAAAEPRRALLVAIYAVAVLLVAAVVGWAAYSQWGRRAPVEEDER
jgi:hypothetical protein